MMASLVTLGSIETAALFQSPLKPDPIHTHALSVKGTMRYVTDAEDDLHSIAMPAFLASFVLAGALGLSWSNVKRRDEKRELENTFRRLDSENHGE
jgi:hypothetical protein